MGTTINPHDEVTIETLLAMVMADIDIFLLQDDKQLNDLNKTYTTQEIRSQLENTLIKISKVFEQKQINRKTPLFKAISLYDKLTTSVLSQRQKIKIIEEFTK